jgi:sulfide:quinone oxidoreductase
MDIKQLTPQLSVMAQIAPGDMPAVAALGFKSIVCNRPDGEDGASQPAFAEIEALAHQLGMQAFHQPVVSGGVQDAQGQEFAKILQALPAPVLAYCRSGTRCTTLWALSQKGLQPAERIIETAARAGYDLSGLSHRLNP